MFFWFFENYFFMFKIDFYKKLLKSMKFQHLASLFFTLILFSCQVQKAQKVNYTHPIPYQPENYICYKTDSSIQIDGKLDETIWQKAIPTNDFQDIEGNLKPLPSFQTNVKMLWDEDYFYFGAYMKEPHIWGKLTERDAVIFYDNDFEIFLDPDGDSHNYYEFEMNALNTVWDLLLLRPYREDGTPKVLDSWDIQGLKTAVHINGTLNNPTDIDSFWTVEVAIPWKVLEEMTPNAFRPKEGVQWRVNFSRVNWEMNISNGDYQKQKDKNGKRLPEKNWVWSPQGYIAMHAPETWGWVQFSEIIAGTDSTNFISSPDEEIKWALRQLYYQQRLFYKKNKKYTNNLKAFTLPKIQLNNYNFIPKIYLTNQGYEMVAASADSKMNWLIREDGKIFKVGDW